MRLHSYLCENLFQRSDTELTLYIKKKENDILVICIYVDDIIYMWVHLNISLMRSNDQ